MANEECPFYESVHTVLKAKVSDEEKRAHLRKMGVENTLLNAIHLKMSEKAAEGDVQAAKYLRDIALAQESKKNSEPVYLPGMDLTALTDEQLHVIAAQEAEKA